LCPRLAQRDRVRSRRFAHGAGVDRRAPARAYPVRRPEARAPRGAAENAPHALLPRRAGDAVTARSVPVTGDRLSEFLREPPASLTEVDVISSPPSWAPLKPLLLRFVRSYRERGLEPPVFRGVPLCLFGSEWSGFRSRARTT